VIKSIDYEAALSRLTVTFTTGRIYDYFAVPANVAEAFRASNSKGAYFNAHIRDVYPCKERRLAPSWNASAALRESLKRSAREPDRG
jgi:hypothetical protein